MSLWSKILLGLVAVATLGCLYLAAKTLKAEQSWQTRVREFEQKIEPLHTEIETLEQGGANVRSALPDPGGKRIGVEPANPDDKLGLLQTRALIDKALAQRGRAWYHVQPGEVVPATGEVSVTVDLPNPHQIATSTVLYAFDEQPAEEGGVYLGEFKVTAVNGQVLTLTPTRALMEREMQRLQSTRGTWTLYEVMPSDSHDVFVGLSDDIISRMLPETSREAFLRDGQASRPDDAAENVVDEKFVRPLQDYGLSFAQLQGQLAKLRSSIEALTSDVGKLDTALPAIGNPALPASDPMQTGQLAAAYASQVKLEAELATLKAETEVVTARQQALSAQLEQLQATATRLLAENQKLGDEITSMQMQAAGVASGR